MHLIETKDVVEKKKGGKVEGRMYRVQADDEDAVQQLT